MLIFLSQPKRKGKKLRKNELNDLKQELYIDHHKISFDELYTRFETNPENASGIVKFPKNRLI